jgi:hypothetical protein
MKSSNTGLWVALIAVAIIAIGGYMYPHVQQAIQQVGGVSNYDTLGLSGLQVGTGCNNSFGSCTGTTIARINTGQCFIKPYATTIAASSTAVVDCQATAAVGSITGTTAALAGVTLGDNVVATLSTTTAGVAAASGGIVITGASASTTAGYITETISNLSGTTFTWPVNAAASGTESYIVTK